MYPRSGSLLFITEDGTLSVPAWPTVQPEFISLISMVTAHLTSEFGGLIHSLYLYGSVARGEAISGESDLDVSIVFNKAPGPDEEVRLEALRKSIESDHSVITKVDFDIGIVASVLDPSCSESWGYWLKHCCRCIWGDDLASAWPPFRPSRNIARAVNGDYSAFVHRRLHELVQAYNSTEAKKIKKEIAKRLIRATHNLRKQNASCWPVTLEELCSECIRVWPEQRRNGEFLLAQASAPDEEWREFTAVAKAFCEWLCEKETIMD